MTERSWRVNATSGRVLPSRWGTLVAVVGCAVLLGTCHVVCARGTLSGSNRISLSVVELDPFSVVLSDAASLLYRLDRFSLGSDTVFSSGEPVSQNFRLTAPWGDFTMRGSLSFSSTSFARAAVSFAGIWEGVSIITTATLSDMGSLQTPSYLFGNAWKVSGQIPGFGRLAIGLDVGGADATQSAAPCPITFKRMRISWGDLPFCGGTADLAMVLGCYGLEAEVVTWQVPLSFCDFNMQITLRYLDLLDFQGASVSMVGGLWGLNLSGNFAFDADYAFQRGAWSLSGPFFSGTLSSSTAFDKDGLLSQDLSWVYQGVHCSLMLASSLEITTFDWGSLTFDVPLVHVGLQCDVICCDGVNLGELGLTFELAKDKIEHIELVYSYSF